MDLQVIFDCIVPDNIKNIPLIKVCTNIFIEQINRNSQIAINIGKLFDLENDTQIKIDGDNITQIIDSDAVKNSKDILRLGLFYTYINSIYTLILRLQRDRKISERFFNSEYLGGLREYQKNCGSKRAIHYMYAFAKYLETGTIVHDLELTEGSILNLRYDGSLNKDIFIDFNKPLAHPCGWLCEYERFEPYVPVPIPKDLNFLDAPLDDSIIDLMENYSVIDNYHRDIYDENYNVVETQTFYRYTNGVTDKCLYFPRLDWGVEVDNTEYPPIDYSENDFKQVAEIYSADLEGQYTGKYSTSGISQGTNEYYTRHINVSDTNYDDTLLSIPNNYNGISAGGYGFYAGNEGTEIEPYAKIQYDDGRLTTVIDPEKFSVGSNGGYESDADTLSFYFSLNEDNVVSDELKFTFSIRPKFIVKNPSEYITYMNDRNYSSPNYWTFFVYYNNAFTYYSNKYYSSGTPITEDDFFFTTVVANAYPSDYLFHTIDSYYLKARMYLTYNLRNSKKFGYYLVINNESIKDAWNCRDALENTANGIDFKSNYTVIDLTEKGLNEEWIDIEVIVSSHNTTLNVDNNSYDFEVSNDNSDTVLVEVLPNIENFKGRNNNEHVLLFYEQIADFKLFLKPRIDFWYPWINVDCQFLYDKVVLTADVYNDDPLGYSLLWSTGERTRSIEVPYEEQPHYEVTATNRAGSTTEEVSYFSYCGYEVYSLDFCLKDDLETPPIYNLEFDFKATIDDLKPLIYLQGYWNEKVLSLGACYYSYNDYLYLDNTDENKVPYDNKYLNNWYHYKVHVDNTNLIVSININDNEVATINLNEELIPRIVEFSCGLNGFFGCTTEYYIDNLKITYKEEEWQH